MTARAGALAIVAFLAVFLIPYVATILWVYRDARRREDPRARSWAGVVLLAAPAFPLAFVAYLLLRRDGDPPPPARLDRFLRNVAVAVVLGVVGAARVSPPDPLAQASAVAVALPVVVLLALLVTYRDVLVGVVWRR